MNGLSRRRFLTRGSIGVALASAAVLVPGLATVLRLPAPPLASGAQSIAEPLVAHVRDLASGEISLLVGTDQVIHRDVDLAARLYAAARRTATWRK
jgi:hypothetical protein